MAIEQNAQSLGVPRLDPGKQFLVRRLSAHRSLRFAFEVTSPG